LDEVATLLTEVETIEEHTDLVARAAYQRLAGPDNPERLTWNRAPIGSLLANAPNNIRTGPFGSDLLVSEFVDKGVSVLGIDNTVDNRFGWQERRYITEKKYETLSRYTVRPGDVIVTIMGTVGRTAVIPPDIGPAISTKHLVTITPDINRIVPEYLASALRFDPGIFGRSTADQRGAIMDGLNMTIVREAEIPVAPIPVQERIRDATYSVEQLQDATQRIMDAAWDCFRTLASRVFGQESHIVG
jgi:type I restriction enzyme S subunit